MTQFISILITHLLITTRIPKLLFPANHPTQPLKWVTFRIIAIDCTIYEAIMNPLPLPLELVHPRNCQANHRIKVFYNKRINLGSLVS